MKVVKKKGYEILHFSMHRMLRSYSYLPLEIMYVSHLILVCMRSRSYCLWLNEGLAVSLRHQLECMLTRYAKYWVYLMI